MKQNAYLFLVIILMSCFGSARQGTSLSVREVTLLEGQGLWLLTQYFDSAVSKSSVHKVKDVGPSRFASIIKIIGDSIRTFGSMEDLATRQFGGPRAGTLTTSYGKWDVTLSDSILLMREHGTNNKEEFVYRRYKESQISDFDKEDYDLLLGRYFNMNILSGQYEVLTPLTRQKQKISFRTDGSVENLGDYDKYDIYTFHGSRHPYSESDVLTLSNFSNDSTKFLAWILEKDFLSLYQLSDDAGYPGEIFHKGKEFMKLKKLE